MSDNRITTQGIGFFGVLTLIFITLKLTGVITWSWWWVLITVWVPPALILVIILIGLMIACIQACFCD